ncbi:MAG: RNA polymerase sigma factor [Verrucomicrobia bacterium]|nr:RNA polymerase sigma factor [Verrucomicrobiota bacterium]
MGSIEVNELGRWFEGEAGRLVLYARQWLDQAAAEDVVQDVFVQLILQRQPPHHMKAWLCRAVRNAALKHRRTGDRRQRREEHYAAATPSCFESPAAGAIDARHAETALGELPEGEREIVVLRIWGGLTFEEIAGVVNASGAMVFRSYRRGLEQLRRKMGVLCQTKTN